MIQNVLTGIGGVGVYGAISICLFVAVFLAVVLWMFGLKKSYLKSMRELPLADDDVTHKTQSQLNRDTNHE
jgi:cbb3-type cytochrome oxidase subunit 3